LFELQMTIELLYYPLTNSDIQRKRIEDPHGTDISAILPMVSGKGLAEWQDDRYGGQVTGEYKTAGAVEDGKAYCILSGNVDMTMKIMNQGDNLFFISNQ